MSDEEVSIAIAKQITGGDHANMSRLYIAVTPDVYELPVAVADSGVKLSRMLHYCDTWAAGNLWGQAHRTTAKQSKLTELVRVVDVEVDEMKIGMIDFHKMKE